MSDNTIYADSIIFFDLDGTLVDTDYTNFLAYKKAIGLVAKTNFDINFNPKCRFDRSVLIDTLPNLTEIDLEVIICEKEKYYTTFLSKTQLNKSIVEVLLRYYKTNKTVLVTNSRKERALAILNYHGLIDKFDNLFFREYDNNSCHINKFKNAILKLGISPSAVVVFENEESEIALAQEAGICNINQ